MDKKIKCKFCGNEMALEDAVVHELREQLNEEISQKEKAVSKAMEQLKLERLELDNKLKEARKNYSEQLSKDRERITNEIKEELTKKTAAAIRLMKEELHEKDKQIREVEEMELNLIKKEAELAEQARRFNLVVSKKINEERERIFEDAKNKAIDELSIKMTYLEQELQEKQLKLKQIQKLELDMIKERRELEDKKRDIELEVEKRASEELEKARANEREKLVQEHKLVDLQKEKKIDSLLKEIEKLKEIAERGSQKLQGDVLEDDLLYVLQRNFPLDDIEAVPNGVNGADVIQIVRNKEGNECGKIIWEAKNTKQWKDDWIVKLKRDVREVSGDVAILLTSTLPKDVSNFKFMDGVWVTNYLCFLNLAIALRINVIKIYETKILATGQIKKSEMLFRYFCSNEFNQKVEAMTETLSLMSSNLDMEKKSMGKLWAERQKQIEYIAMNVASLYGDVKGMVGRNLNETNSLKILPVTEKRVAVGLGLEDNSREVTVQQGIGDVVGLQ